MNCTVSGASDQTLSAAVQAVLREIPDFPRPGIVFRDITPLLATPALFKRCTSAMADVFAASSVTHVVAIESRGFLFGAPIAQQLGAALVSVRKPGKLPFRPQRSEYALEYGTDALEIYPDACYHRAAVLVVDDVLATGGTAAAAVGLVRSLGAQVVGCSFLVELAALRGRGVLGAVRVESVLTV